MICGLTQSCDLQMMINHKQLNDIINSAFTLWNGMISFICRRERAQRADRDLKVWHKEFRFHIGEIYTNKHLCVSALLRLSGHMTADLSVISMLKALMKVFCHACWLAAFSWRDLSVQSEENMEDLHHALGCIDCFPAAEKSRIKSQRSPNTISHPSTPNVLVSVHFRPDATKSIWLWQRSPRFQQPGGLGLLV